MPARTYHRWNGAALRPFLRRSIVAQGGASAWVERYAERFGLTVRSAVRDYAAVRDGRPLSSITADRVAVFVGEHPAIIWPDPFWSGAGVGTAA